MSHVCDILFTKIGGPDAPYKRRQHQEWLEQTNAMYAKAAEQIRRQFAMTVVAKLSVRDIFGSYANVDKIEASCVCDTEMLNKDTENYRFTKASPWGELRMSVQKHWLRLEPNDEFYIVFDPITQPRPKIDGRQALAVATCTGIEDTGGTTRVFRWSGVYENEAEELLKGSFGCNLTPNSSFAFRMAVDNPAVFGRFEAGRKYWVTITPARLGSPFPAITQPLNEDEGEAAAERETSEATS
jgi:hypothetical protein